MRILLMLLGMVALLHALCAARMVATVCTIFDRDGTTLQGAGRISAGHVVCTAQLASGPRATFTAASTGFDYNCDGTLPSAWSETIDAQGHAALVCTR